MKIILSILLALTFVCCQSNADILRDLQHEIDVINIYLAEEGHSKEEIEYMRGKSFGIFLSIELVRENGIL